tara:strand:+ start:310 stop:2391 length:2082 start_codon:yes stop_codon:yes gene_type:complete
MAKTNKVGKPGIGVAGNTGYYGQADDEYLRKLQGQSGRAIYDRMRRSDPQVGSILRAITLPIRQATYYIEPPSDDSSDQEIAENAETDFLLDMSITWDDMIRHTCLMFPFGFSILEKVWEYSDKKSRIIPHKLDPRLPQSIAAWEYDKKKRRLINVIQQDSDGVRIKLPIEKLLVFTTEKEGDNWEGIAILRNSYKPWVIKDDLERINAIKHDRHGVGIPVMHVPDNVVEGTKEYEATADILDSIHANEQTYVIEPEGYTFRVEGAGGSEGGTDVLPDLKYYDEMIARSAMAMFLTLGTTETGSRALGGTFLESFLSSVQAFADYICEVFTRFALIEYVNVNYQVNEYPRLKVRRIQKLNPTVLAELANAGLINPDETLENSIRVDLNLPEKQEDTISEPEIQGPKNKPTDDETEPEDDELSAVVKGDDNHIYDFLNREPRGPETLCKLADIEMRLNGAVDGLTEKVKKWRDKQIDYAIRAVVGGRAIQKINLPYAGSMHKALLDEYKNQANQGKIEITEEMQRQVTRSLSLAEDLPDFDRLVELMTEELSIKVQGAGDKLKTQIASYALDLRKAGYTGDELLRKLEDAVRAKITDAPLKELAAVAVNNGWGAGRQVGMESYEDEIESVYRSAILDGNLCEICRPKDGVTHDLRDPVYIAPDPECEGGPSKCRCINIAVMKAESEPEEYEPEE